jgi:hypothetical protein
LTASPLEPTAQFKIPFMLGVVGHRDLVADEIPVSRIRTSGFRACAGSEFYIRRPTIDLTLQHPASAPGAVAYMFAPITLYGESG